MILNVRTSKGQIVPLNVEKISEKKLLLTFRYNPELVAEVKSLEAAQWNPDEKFWTAADSERNWYNLTGLENPHHTLYDEPLRQAIIDSFKETKDNYYHQQEFAAHTYQRRRSITAGEMGTGKTKPNIRVMEKVGGYWWIVAPKTAKYAWRSEMHKWQAKLREIQTLTDRDKRYKLISYNYLDQAVAQGPNHWPDNIMFDECHKLKNPQSLRSQAASIVCAAIRKNNGLIGLLSGSPNPNDPTDIWNAVELCQPGFLRESSPTKLAHRLGITETGIGRAGIQFKKVISWKQDELELLYKRLRGLMFVKFKHECLDLPAKQYIEKQLELTPDIIKQAKFVAEAADNKIESLRQLSDGFTYSGGNVIDTPKDEALIDLLEQLTVPRVVIFAAYTQSVDKVERLVADQGWTTIRLDGRGIKSKLDNPLDVFQSDSPEPIAFIGQPEAGGISITLTKANTIIYYSNSFKADARIQSEDRIHRIGMGSSATIIDLLWLPTDKYVLDTVKHKRDVQAITLGEIKQLLDQPEFKL